MHPPEWDCLSFSFFFSCVAFCPGGLQVLKRAQYPHIHILNLFWCQSPSQWTTPAPSAVSASHNACCSGRYILIYPHIANQCLRPRNGLRLESFQITPPLPNRKEHLVARLPSMQTAGDIECKVRCQFSLDIFSKNTLEFFIGFTLLFDPWSENFPQAW